MAEMKKKKRGRPLGSKSDMTSNKSLSNVRITQEQLNTYKQASQKAGKTFSAWVRDALDKEANGGGN